MILVDKLLFAPIYAALWAARQINNTIEQDRAAAPERVTDELRELYMRLETGQVNEAEFAAREKELLDELERVQSPDRPPAAASGSGERTKRRARARKSTPGGASTIP